MWVYLLSCGEQPVDLRYHGNEKFREGVKIFFKHLRTERKFDDDFFQVLNDLAPDENKNLWINLCIAHLLYEVNYTGDDGKNFVIKCTKFWFNKRFEVV